MPGTTAKLLLPYPLSTDPVSDGDDQMKALADRLELLIGAPWTPYVPGFAGMTGTVDLARFWCLGPTVIVQCKITIATVTGGIQVAVPSGFAIHAGAAAAQFRIPLGNAIAVQAATTAGPVWPNASQGTFSFGATTWGVGVPAAWSAGHTLGFTATYERA
jgi:hypothetical protein